MTDERQLIEKLLRIEALFARAGTDGEKTARQGPPNGFAAGWKKSRSWILRSSIVSRLPTDGRASCFSPCFEGTGSTHIAVGINAARP